MKFVFCLALTLFSSNAGAAISKPKAVSFNTADGGVIHADYYPAGAMAVVLAHGEVFNKASWSELVAPLLDNDIAALAIDFRGYGQSQGGTRPNDRFEDVLAAVRYLQQKGIKRIAVLGASMGGGIAGKATTYVKTGEISHLILLSPAPTVEPNKMRAGKLLYIASANEGGITTIKAQFQEAPEPKQLKLLAGSAHAQHIFKTAEKKALIDSIIQFLKGK